MTLLTLLQAAPAAGAAGQQGGGLSMWIMLILIFVVMWLFMIMPQRKQQKKMEEFRKSLKKGDKVVTGGGLIGRVTKVTDTEVEVELGQGVKVRAVKSTLSQVVDPTAAPAAND